MSQPGKYDRKLLEKVLRKFEWTPFEEPYLFPENDPVKWNYDIVALQEREQADPFSIWVAEKAAPYFKRFAKVKKEYGVRGFLDASLQRFTYAFSTALASMLSFAAIAVIFSIDSDWTRFGILAVCNAMVAVCLGLMTEAKRADIFAVSIA